MGSILGSPCFGKLPSFLPLHSHFFVTGDNCSRDDVARNHHEGVRSKDASLAVEGTRFGTFLDRGPQYRPSNTVIFGIGTAKKVALILGNPIP